MSFFHHGTIRKYTAAIIDLFSDVEVQYILSNKSIKTKAVPITYSSKEKSMVLDDLTQEQVLSGNFSFLPRGFVSLSAINKNQSRTPNKNLKIGTKRQEYDIEYMFNSVPYDFNFEVQFQCRGMNEATQIIEQVATKFNPIVNIDIWDADNLTESTRIPIKLEGVNLDSEDYDIFSSNIITVSFALLVVGSLYQPLKLSNIVNEFKLYINASIDEFTAERSSLINWDVDHESTE